MDHFWQKWALIDVRNKVNFKKYFNFSVAPLCHRVGLSDLRCDTDHTLTPAPHMVSMTQDGRPGVADKGNLPTVKCPCPHLVPTFLQQ